MDLFYIYNEDGVGNCLFRAVSILIYGTPDHHKDIRETVCDYIATRYGRFYDFILGDLNDCIDQILDEGTWGGEPEVAAFSELYNVTVNIYEGFTSQTRDMLVIADGFHHFILLFLPWNHFLIFGKLTGIDPVQIWIPLVSKWTTPVL